MSRNNITRNLLLFIVIAFFSVAVLIPFVWMILSSFKTDGQILGRPEKLIPESFTIAQYLKVTLAVPFFRFLGNSFIFAGGVTLISLVLDSAAGYAFSKLPYRGSRFFFFLVLVTLMVPFQIIMIPLYLIIFNMQGLNTYWGLILPRITNAFGIYMMRQFFLSLPDDLLDAGRIDGLSELGIFRRIALPLTTSALVTLGVFHFMYNWNDFLWPLLITSTTEMRPLPVGLALFMGEHVMEHGPVIAGSVLSVLPILIIFMFAQKTFIKGIALTGIKS